MTRTPQPSVLSIDPIRTLIKRSILYRDRESSAEYTWYWVSHW